MRRIPSRAAAIVLATVLLVATGCGGGGGVSGDVGVLTAPYLVLDLTTGSIETRTAIADLLTDPKYTSTHMVFRAIASGSSAEGTPADPVDYDLGGQADEPYSAAARSGKYFIGVFEVTQAQWQTLANGVAGIALPWLVNARIVAANGGASAVAPAKPAFGLTFADVVAVLAARNAGWSARLALPDGAQWERACRAGQDAQYSWGTSHLPSVAAQYAVTRETVGGGTGPAVVGSREPNAYGLYDMHGNVWEWTAAGLGSGLIRGGSWHDSLAQARCANRVILDESIAHALVGARLVLAP